MAKFWKKKTFWGTLVAVVLLAFCVKDISLKEVIALSHRISFGYLIPAALCSFMFVTLKGLRWRVIVQPQKKIPIVRAISLYAAGQVINIVMPALTGQVGRLFLFSKMEGLRKTVIFSTIVLEILFDAIAMVIFLLLTSLAFVFPDRYRSASYVLAIVSTAVLVLLYLLLHYQSGLERMGHRWFRARWPGFYISAKKFMRSFTQGIELLRSSQHLLASLGLSIGYWGAHVIVVFFLFRSFDFALPIGAAAMVILINTLALMVPITPGNAGTFEVAVSTSLAAFGVTRSDAVLFALALHILDLLPLWVLGMTFMRYKKVSLADIKSQHQDDGVLGHVSENGVLMEKEESR